MLEHNAHFLIIQILHISDSVIIDIIGDCQFNVAALVVEQVVHETYSLAICMQVVFHAHFSFSLGAALRLVHRRLMQRCSIFDDLRISILFLTQNWYMTRVLSRGIFPRRLQMSYTLIFTLSLSLTLGLKRIL